MNNPLEEQTVEFLAAKYFDYGFQYEEMLELLKVLHKKKVLSLRTLKRILAYQKLYRRKNYTDIEIVKSFLEDEIKKSGQLVGYKWMHLRCVQNNLVVTQDVVRHLLHLLDPVGIETRKRKRLRRRQYSNNGPNYLWHVDSYDKLKPYGICINGCIDGFLRHIIWLKVGLTSSDPKINFNQVVLEWNTHKIRRSRNTTCPTGIPVMMFETPHLYNTHNFLVPVPSFAIDVMKSECKFYDKPCDADFYELCNIVMAEKQYVHQDDPYAALELYKKLRRDLINLFN